MKLKIPSEAQAKRIAKCWADSRPTNIMVRGRDGSAAYNDPTNLVLVKNGWVAPTGRQYEENGYCWESHKITPDGLLGLERYLQKVRLDATSAARSPTDSRNPNERRTKAPVEPHDVQGPSRLPV